MSITTDAQDLYEEFTVSQLRELIQTEGGVAAPSKLRKHELAQYLADIRHNKAQAEEVPVRKVRRELTAEQYEELTGLPVVPEVRTVTVPTVGTFEANEFLAFVGSALAGGLSEQDARELDMAKFRGRYEGKAVKVGSVRGKVTGGTHRDTDPTGRSGGTLLLVVKHDRTRTGHPRATLHRAEDVVLV